MAARWRFRPRIFELAPELEPFELLTRGVLDSANRPILLDSAAGDPCRASLIGFDPLPQLLEPRRGIHAARELLAMLECGGGDDVPGPFHGGFLGAFAYDLGVAGERAVAVAPEPWNFPLAIGGLYVDFVVRDHVARRTWLVLGDEPGDRRPDVDARRRAFEARIARCARGDLAREPASLGRPQRSTPSHEHERRIEVARAEIAAGEYYQANLAHRFTCSCTELPPALYARLRSANPAPYMGLAWWGGEREPRAVLSASPELLLEFDGATARTRPIKGTARRALDAGEDRALSLALLASSKDRAELAMIVDLERNDLGRVAQPGAVWVEGFPTLASYARVHHTSADVVARVRPGVGAVDVLAALFPGGSVTGAPKLAAMAAIARLEGQGRGFYCGSLGFADTRGRAAFNILIRTLLWRPGELSFRVGGGITWPSDARAEDRETLDKAAGLIDALS
jgi:para-aminobenzoate synthetase component 1